MFSLTCISIGPLSVCEASEDPFLTAPRNHSVCPIKNDDVTRVAAITTLASNPPPKKFQISCADDKKNPFESHNRTERRTVGLALKTNCVSEV